MSAAQPPKLLDQIRNLIRLRHMSHKTERAYVNYARDYILFHKKRHPREMGADEIREYLTHLAVDKNVAASTQNVAFNALLFLYKQVMGIELPPIEGVLRARRPAQRKILATMRAMWLSMQPYSEESGMPPAAPTR